MGGVAPVDRCQPLEHLPGVPIGDLAVGVVGILLGRDRRGRDADTEPHAGEREEDGDLVVAERSRPMIAGRQRRDDGERLGRAENRVGAGNGELVDGVRAHHVAEVEKPGDLLGAVRLTSQQHVLVVGVVVDDAHRQARQPRHDPAAVLQDHLLHNASLQWVAEGARVGADPGGSPQIPRDLTIHRRMREIG